MTEHDFLALSELRAVLSFPWSIPRGSEGVLYKSRAFHLLLFHEWGCLLTNTEVAKLDM